MKQQYFRLYFIDVMRAFAIIMMLQGHFIDGLLDPVYRDNDNVVFSTWKYFRGITAPVFFTVAGFIFMYLLIKQETPPGWKNPRVQKGIRRGIMLIGLGYLLRLNFSGLFAGRIYKSFYMVDVLQCIGLSILLLIGIYLFSYKRKKYLMRTVLFFCSLSIFLLAPLYSGMSFGFLPKLLANYFTKVNGSVFTIIPWFGYAAFGAFAAVYFYRYRAYKYLYTYAIGISLVGGLILMYLSSPFFMNLYRLSGVELALRIVENNYLFIRLGNVLLFFVFFMLLRNSITSKTIRTVGKNTLSIYVIHFIILYGSFTGLGLYKFFKYSLSPYIVIPGALIFIIVVSYLSFMYNRLKPAAKEKVTILQHESLLFGTVVSRQIINVFQQLKEKLMALFGIAKN